jgi:hypothetical protein
MARLAVDVILGHYGRFIRSGCIPSDGFVRRTVGDVFELPK